MEFEEIDRTLNGIRRSLSDSKIDIYIVPSTDEHFNEFVPEYKRRIEAISGFSGSAGLAIVSRIGPNQLFVDSRYHLQAEKEVSSSLYEIQKLGLGDTPKFMDWLKQVENERGAIRFGFDSFTTSMKTYRELRKRCDRGRSVAIPVARNLVDIRWSNRPSRPDRPVYILNPSFTGKTSIDKLTTIRQEIRDADADYLIMSKLDEIAWVTNLRGSDIPHNPVFESYCVIDQSEAVLFLSNPLSNGAKDVIENSFRIESYEHYQEYLEAISRDDEKRYWLDAASSSVGSFMALGWSADDVSEKRFITDPSPAALLKAVKNEAEIRCSRDAHRRAGAAKFRSFLHLSENVAAKRAVNERLYAESLHGEYKLENGFADLSFPTIAAFAGNGAIVHYSTPDDDTQIREGKLLLIDSGIHLAGATTDDTRTIVVGQPTEKQQDLYTRVLQSHIQLASQMFPEGTHGAMLDGIARASLWNAGLDYGHGTGHGVGVFLNVHEGPQKIASSGYETELKSGMIVSIEPGYYEAGWGGIRLENLYVVREVDHLPAHPAGKKWLHFEFLTLIPFARPLVIIERLSAAERDWLRNYHRRVDDEIAPMLNERDRESLKIACRGW